jgi:hypothetical protein
MLRIALKRPGSLAALCCSLALLAAWAPRARAQAPRADHPVVGLIGEKYRKLGGSAGPLGRSTGPETDAREGRGRHQTFEHGAIGWTPSTGPKSVQAAYVKNGVLHFEWGDTAPFHYDFFLVRWDLNGKNVGQERVTGSRTGGRWSKRLGAGGRYRVVVEGGTRGGFLGHSHFRQGWSNPLYFDYTLPGPDYTPYRPAVRLPAPAARKVTAHIPGGLHLREWMRLGGPDGPMGAPLSGVRRHAGGGKGEYVQFQNGQVSRSPDVWERGVLAAYQDGDSILVDWTVSWGEPHPPSRYNYDRFIVRWDYRGRNAGQADVNADGGSEDTHLRTRGWYRIRPPRNQDGDYVIRVEGVETPGFNLFRLFSHSRARQGWMHPVTVRFSTAHPPRHDNHARVSLKDVPPATSVADAKAKFDRRTAAAVLYHACRPLPPTMYRNEQDFGAIILAKLAYPDYFQSDRLPGRDEPVRQEAIEALRRQQVGSRAGTRTDSFPVRTGEYDVNLTWLVSVIYKYYHVLPRDVQDHIIDNLLNQRGPFDPGDTRPFSPLPVPETENHLMMIESARYLTNQLLHRRTGDPRYDNARNGMDGWMLKHLQNFLKNDFIEYNARPYQDYTMSALLNLYSYTSAHSPSASRVKTAARMVLDYLMAKVAVSSNDSRRSVTYRRKASYNTPGFIDGHIDPQNAFSMAFAGTTDMVGTGTLPGNFAWEMQWAGLSEYRVPDAVLDLMVNRPHRVFFQRFHHHATADEIYAGSPSYLISSGGRHAKPAYSVLGVLHSDDDIGLAVPTTFMPTGQFTTRDDLIRFDGARADARRSNLGVAEDFACGLNPVVPKVYAAAAVGVDRSGRRRPGSLNAGPWTFIDQSTPKLRKGTTYTTGPDRYGYYVAVYRDNGFGFLEAYDTARRPGLKFNDFIDGVLRRNGKTAFRITGRNTYVMTDGRKVQFQISPDSVVFHPAEKSFFASGTVLNSAAGSGVITIENPRLRKRIILDFRDWRAPTRREVG